MSQSINYKYLAGIVPVTGQSFDFKTVIHHSLSLVAEDYTAIERAVIECAWAGCRTIWLCVDSDVEPIIRKRIGDYVEDPVYTWRKYGWGPDPKADITNRPTDFKKYIPVYYIPTLSKERGKIDSYGWGLITAARAAISVGSQIGEMLQPTRFYAAFPYGVYDPGLVRAHRRQVAEGPFAFQHEGETFKDGKHIGFTLEPSDIKTIAADVRKRTTKQTILKEELKPGENLLDKEVVRLYESEAYSASRYSLAEVVDSVSIKKYTIADIEDYKDIRTWEGYTTAMARCLSYTRPNALPGLELSRYGEASEREGED